MRGLLLPLLLLGCAPGEEPEDSDEVESLCNHTEVSWAAVGSTAQAATVCASSQPDCDCFVIGGSHFEEDHLCLMVAYDAVADDVTLTGEAGWTLEHTEPEGTDCSSGIPCVGDLPSGTPITVRATHPAGEELEAQEVEIRFTATAAKLESIDVRCP